MRGGIGHNASPMRHLRVIASVALGAFAIAAGSAVAAKPTVTISGSTSFYPLMTALVPAFLNEKGPIAKFNIYGGGSDVGISDAAYGRVTMGMTSRDEKGSDAHGLGWSRIARDAICLVTNRSNPIANLDSNTVRSIFTGKTVNWKDVPGSKLKTPINVIGRTISSGTQDMFEKLFLGYNQFVTRKASLKATNGLVQDAVKADRNAIGYVSMGFTGGLGSVPYDGVACNLTNAKSGNYLAVRNFWLVTPGPPSGIAKTFINWAQTSRSAQAIIARGYVPLN